jgi:flagella synthesis protein FlgN
LNSNAATPAGKNFLAKLNDERDALRAFVVLLEQEQQVLLGTDTEPLLALAESKTRSSERLITLAQERRKSIPGADSTETWLKMHAPEGLASWQAFLELANHAQRMNHTNGELIQIKMRYNTQALAVLVGATQHAAGLYGPDGQTNLPSTGRTLGSV